MNKIISGVVVIAAATGTLNAQADRLDEMISPAFHQVNFEDPRPHTGAQFLFVNHKIDDKFITTGGDVQVYALQLRAKINDELSFIATKDGFVDFNPDGAVPKDTGFADIEAGLNYNFYKDSAEGETFSAQLRYLIPTGKEEVFQGQGDGMLHPSVSGAFALGDATSLVFGTGLRIPMDTKDSMFWDSDIQVDHKIDMGSWSLHPLIGASLIHVVDGGDRLPIADEGQDFFNFGASKSTGEDIAIGAAGLVARVAEKVDLGASFQFPFDAGTGTRILDSRWTISLNARL